MRVLCCACVTGWACCLVCCVCAGPLAAAAVLTANCPPAQRATLISFGFTPGVGAVVLYVEKVRNRGLCAQAQAESLRYKLLKGLQVRRACYGVMRYVMEQGAKGCEVVVSGKLRAQRAKVMKFKDGYMIKTGSVCDRTLVVWPPRVCVCAAWAARVSPLFPGLRCCRACGSVWRGCAAIPHVLRSARCW